MEIKFRIATIDDIKDTIDLCNECFNENTSYDYAIKSFMSTKEDSNQIYLNGYIGNEIVSHVKITIIPTMYEDMNTYAILNHVCVKEKYRRNNIATMMLDEVTKICLDKNCKVMELWSKNFRIPAHECYKHYGFELIEAGFFLKNIQK